ncbi:hypothetical protein ACQUY5_25090 [Bacillus cereus]|uniref:hypothetical protein n=1 Tax=Bacillus cereus TaxID=1396 RepID=UPI003D174BD0
MNKDNTNGYVVQLSPNERDWGSLLKQPKELQNTLMHVTSKVFLDVSESLYSYRCKVLVDKDKMDRVKEKEYNFDRELGRKLSSFRRKVSRGIARRSLESEFPSIDPLSTVKLLEGNVSFLEVVNFIFDNVKDKNETEGLTKEDYIGVENLKREITSVEKLAVLVHSLTSDSMFACDYSKKVSLPVNHQTVDYLKLDKGQTLIGFTLSVTTKDAISNNNRLVNRFLSLLDMSDLQVSSLFKRSSRIILNVLCKNEETDKVLQLFEQAYSGHNYALHNDNHEVDIDITQNVGQEDQSKSWYKLLNGDYFQEVRKTFDETNETFIGFPLVK